MGTHTSHQLGCLSRPESLVVSSGALEVNEKEEGWAFKNMLWVGAGTKMRSQYLLAHKPMA